MKMFAIPSLCIVIVRPSASVVPFVVPNSILSHGTFEKIAVPWMAGFFTHQFHATCV